MHEGEIWDPLRKKMVALTAEEHVRQWFIDVLHRKFEVPLHMMMSEVTMKFGMGQGNAGHLGKQYRADILVYGRGGRPLMVVECKRQEVALERAVLEQALRYNMVLNVNYIAITNGKTTFVCEKTAAGYVFLNENPKYEEMIRHDAERKEK